MKLSSLLRLLTEWPAGFWVEHGLELLAGRGATVWPASNSSSLERAGNLLGLETNTAKVGVAGRSRCAVRAVLLLRTLRNTSYWTDSGLAVPGSDIDPFTPSELIIGRVLLRLALVRDMNSHPVWGVEGGEGEDIATQQLGSGLYTALASYFNSACNPNTVRLNLGREMVLVAARDIQQGEEITDNYCIHYSDLPAGERRQWFRVRGFSLSRCKTQFSSHQHMSTSYLKT